MRGSSAPSFDARAKYGMPLQGSRTRPPPRGERRAPKAPMFSPAIEPQRSFELHPPPLSNDEALMHASEDSVSKLRAHRDVYPGPLEDGRWTAARSRGQSAPATCRRTWLPQWRSRSVRRPVRPEQVRRRATSGRWIR
jgi:hypothetical protein